MKRFAIALLLTVALCGSALAQQVIICPGPGAPPEGPQIVEETVDIDVAVTQVLRSAEAVADKAAQATGEVAQPLDMAAFGMSQAIFFLKREGVDEEKLASIVEARDKIVKGLEVAGPTFGKGVAAGRYGSSLADGSNADKLRAAALYLDAAAKFVEAGKALEGLPEVEAKAREAYKAIVAEREKADAEE